VLQRSVKRPRLSGVDRWLWVRLSRNWSGWRAAFKLLKPATVIGWHYKGFRLFWTWKSHHARPGRPAVSLEVRQLIRRMSRENPLWGARKIHGELLNWASTSAKAA
jgi:putative transposase